jgi:hypothetical protein
MILCDWVSPLVCVEILMSCCQGDDAGLQHRETVQSSIKLKYMRKVTRGMADTLQRGADTLLHAPSGRDLGPPRRREMGTCLVK